MRHFEKYGGIKKGAPALMPVDAGRYVQKKRKKGEKAVKTLNKSPHFVVL